MEFILIRHGRTFANENNIYSTPNTELSMIGRRDLEASKIRVKDVFYDRIMSSPYLRALQTSEILNESKVPIEKLSIIREMSFGILEGKSFEKAFSNHPKALEKWIKNPYEFGPEGGESITDAMKRAEVFLSGTYEGKPIFVSHDGFIRACICYILKDPKAFFHFKIENGSINKIKRESGRFTITQING